MTNERQRSGHVLKDNNNLDNKKIKNYYLEY